MALKDLGLTEQIQELNKVAGYDLSSALQDPSRKTEIAYNLRKLAAAQPAAPAAPAAPAVVPVATPENPVVNRSASTPSASPASTFGTTEADKYYAIASKAPSALTSEDSAYLRGLKAKAALVGGLDKALGIGGNVWNGNRVQMSDDAKLTNRTDATPTFILTDSNGVTRTATPAEAEALRRSTIGQAAETQYNEGLALRKSKQAEEAAYQAEKERRLKADKEFATSYEAQLRSAADKSIANIRAAGQKRLDATQNSFSALGGGRSTDAAKAISEVGQYIQDQVAAEEQKYQLQVQKYVLEQQGATADALKPYQDNIAKLDQQIAQSQALSFKRVQELNEAAQADNKTALQNLMNSLTEETKASVFASGFDQALSEKYGYFMKKDAQGNPVAMVGKDGEPIAFKKAAAAAPEAQRIGTDANGNPTYGYWDAEKKAFVPSSAPAASGPSAASGIPSAGFTANAQVTRSGTVANDTNNPGNITADSIPAGYTKESYAQLIGATGTYLSPNGREYFVFPTAQAGLAALQRDIAAKQAGRTQSGALQGNPTLGDYLRVHTGSAQDNTSYGKAVSDLTGKSLATPFKSVDTDKLAAAVAKAEGFTGAAVPSATPETDAMRLLNLIDKGPKTEDDRKTARTLLKEAGGDFDKALLAYAGFKIDADKKDQGLAFLQSMQAAGMNPRDFTNLDSVSKRLNAGDLNGAYEALERAAYNSPTGKQLKLAGQDADYRTAITNYQQLADMLKAQGSKFGIVSGRISDLKKNVVGDYDLQRTLSALTATFAGLRKNFAGAAVTETELKALKDYIDGNSKEPLVNIKAKIDEIMQRLDNEYEANRRTAGLPELTSIDQVKNRAAVYAGSPQAGVAETPAPGNNAADPLGILD